MKGLSEEIDVVATLNDFINTSCSYMNGVDETTLINQGGHFGSSELTALEELSFEDKPIEFNGSAQDNPELVTGKTNEGDLDKATITHFMPQHAKIVEIDDTFDSPPGFSFIIEDTDYKTIKIHRRYVVGYPNELIRMPGCMTGLQVLGQHYSLSRGDTANHPEGNWGVRQAVINAADIASLIFDYNSHIISYNDLSLPLGGKFGNHRSHRDGKDIDVNKALNGDYSCRDKIAGEPNPNYKQFIQNVVLEVAKNLKSSRPKFECEKNNSYNMHIDLVY